MTWIQTASGRAFSLIMPTAAMVYLPDIVHSLSRIVRFNGHTLGWPYTVAQHSLLVASLVDPEHRKDALLHDAGEAYYGDLSTPLKQAMELAGGAPGFIGVRRRVDAAIAERFGVNNENEVVKRADILALEIERSTRMGPCERQWQTGRHVGKLVAPYLSSGLAQEMTHREVAVEFERALRDAGVK